MQQAQWRVEALVYATASVTRQLRQPIARRAYRQADAERETGQAAAGPDTLPVVSIIFLNGSSSSGKTTLALALQSVLEGAWQHIALDQFRDGLPGRYRGLNAPPGSTGASGLNVVPVDHRTGRVTEIRFGEHGEAVLRGMRRATAAFAETGQNIIIDDLLFEPSYLDDYIDVLAPFDVYFVGVRCPIEVVEAREGTRPGRFPGTALSHFDSVHAHGLTYDIEVDTAELSPRQAAARIQARLSQPPHAFRSLRT